MIKIEDLAEDLEMCNAVPICHFCRQELMSYTTKKGWTYLANPDKSPHRKAYVCCYSWADYKQIEPIKHSEPKRDHDLDDYGPKFFNAIDPKDFEGMK